MPARSGGSHQQLQNGLRVLKTTTSEFRIQEKSPKRLVNIADSVAGGLWGEIRTLGTGSWSETTCRKQEFHVGYSNMAFCRPLSPIRGEPKVMQSGRFVIEKSIVSSSHKVKRVATDPPNDFPTSANNKSPDPLDFKDCTGPYQRT
ncbi:hypothetical protein CFP56_004856 [Quercus suber]|uniref:Uncharacterized protein n=1 Tax=Quercus suber TaxID=58331 RepID=A0AAW0M831_QUESU